MNNSPPSTSSTSLPDCNSDELIRCKRIEARIISGFSNAISSSLALQSGSFSIPPEYPDKIIKLEGEACRSCPIGLETQDLYEKLHDLELELRILNHKISFYLSGFQKRIRSTRRRLKYAMRRAKTAKVFEEYNQQLRPNSRGGGTRAIPKPVRYLSFGRKKIREIPCRAECKEGICEKRMTARNRRRSKRRPKISTAQSQQQRHRPKRQREHTSSSMSPIRKLPRYDAVNFASIDRFKLQRTKKIRQRAGHRRK